MSNTPNTVDDPMAMATTAPALNPPVWSGRKTAIAAALAIGISTAGAAAAATAVPVGSAQTDQGQFQRGGFQPGGPGGPGIPGGAGGFGGQAPSQGVPANPNGTAS